MQKLILEQVLQDLVSASMPINIEPELNVKILIIENQEMNSLIS